MKSPLAQSFVDSLLASVPESSRAAVLLTLHEWQGSTIYVPMQSRAEHRIAVAEKLLLQGMTTADAVTGLRERFGISARQAQRDVLNAKTNVVKACPIDGAK